MKPVPLITIPSRTRRLRRVWIVLLPLALLIVPPIVATPILRHQFLSLSAYVTAHPVPPYSHYLVKDYREAFARRLEVNAAIAEVALFAILGLWAAALVRVISQGIAHYRKDSAARLRRQEAMLQQAAGDVSQ